MRAYQPTYKDRRTGQYRCQAKYWVEFRDQLGIQRRLPACSHKRQAEDFGRQVETLVRSRLANERPDEALLKWLEALPASSMKKLELWGILPAGRISLARPLTEHLADFEKSLQAKARTAQHIREILSPVREILAACAFCFWREISASRVEAHLGEIRETKHLSARTYNHKLKAFKQFCAWMVADGRAVESPVKHLAALNIQEDRRRVRRALEPEEARKLLEAASKAGRRYGMEGQERALLYRLAMETGLRAGEIRSLTAGSIDVGARIITVAAADSKHRQEDAVFLKADTAGLLAQRIAGRKLSESLFTLPSRWELVKMLRADLCEAGIPYQDERGRYVDFHSFRHTTGTWLARTGVHPKVAQSIMRHSDINLTMNTYTHVLREHETKAVEGLPNLSVTNAKRESA